MLSHYYFEDHIFKKIKILGKYLFAWTITDESNMYFLF